MVFTPQATQQLTGVETNDWSNDSGDSDISVSDVFDFENMSASEITKYALEHQDWYKENAALVDYWLNEKSYYGREDTKIARYMQQLKDAGINPILAYQYAGNASASGGASSGAADYFASLTASERQLRGNLAGKGVDTASNIVRGILALIGTLAIAAAM